MTALLGRSWIALSAVGLMILGGCPALAVDSPSPLRIIQGIATTADGKPVAGATLYLLDLPERQSQPIFDERRTVVTDAAGRFTWSVPDDVTWNVPSSPAEDSDVLSCYALRIGVGWTLRYVSGSNTNTNAAPRDLLQKSIHKCKTRWLSIGNYSELSIVVPEIGTLNLLVRGPDGQALKNRGVQLVVTGGFYSFEGSLVYQGHTDTEGHLRMGWYPGVQRMLVLSPGVGFGSTGTFQVLAGEESAPGLPPLAPFAGVSGIVDPALIKRGAFVHTADSWSEDYMWYDPHAAVDAQGRFTLDGVLPGDHHLVLVGGQGESDAGSVTVYPGEQVTEVALRPRLVMAPIPIPKPAPAPRKTSPEATMPSIEGHVTDTAGHPIANAAVYALSSYFGAIRMYQEVLTARTDATGAYRITGLHFGQGGPYISLVAVREGYPLAVVPAQPDSAASDAITVHFHGNLVLPADHPGLTVQVLRDKKPVGGALVRLTPTGGTGLYGRAYAGTVPGRARDLVESLLHPTAATDGNGEAHFTNLAPGLWDIAAVWGGGWGALDWLREWNGGHSQTIAFNISRGVSVTVGPPRHFTLKVYSQPGEFSFRVLDPHGQPPADPNIAFNYGQAAYPSASSTFAKLDEVGNGKYSFEQPGLWRVVARFRDTPLDDIPLSTEPFCEGSALLAVSPSLPRAGPTVIRAIRRGPGSIRVKLVDAVGQPSAGAVFIGGNYQDAQYAASSDSKGEVVFPDVRSGQYTLRANFPKQARLPDLGRDDQPFPTDTALTGVSLLAPQTVIVKADEETLVTFHPQLEGYVRGKVAASDNPANYHLSPPYDQNMPSGCRYDPKSGEFVAGPIAPDRTTFYVAHITPGVPQSATSQDTFPIEVVAGKVVHAILTPKPQPAPASGGNPESMLTMGGVFSTYRRSSISGQVYGPDGVTPAWGARAALVMPQTWQPVQMAAADALGRLAVGEHWYNTDKPANPPPGSPMEPVIVAWLPGANGAVIAPYEAGKEARLVLPAPASIIGRVTVGRQSVAGLTSSFRILAAYGRRGKLNGLLSVEATAQADGSFELSGLTPGTHQIQAARDGIWLSDSSTVVVGSSALLEQTLNINPPGSPLILRLVDETGKPVRDRRVNIVRPAGPLAEELWPKYLTTDAVGDLRLEGLEAQTHRLEIAGAGLAFGSPPQIVDVDVPPVGDGSVVERRVVVQ